MEGKPKIVKEPYRAEIGPFQWVVQWPSLPRWMNSRHKTFEDACRNLVWAHEREESK